MNCAGDSTADDYFAHCPPVFAAIERLSLVPAAVNGNFTPVKFFWTSVELCGINSA
jgi:hypothetical protein